MGTIVTLTALAVAAGLVLFTLAVAGFLLKTVFWLVLLPIRFVFKLLFWVLGAGFAVLMLPIILVIGLVGIVGGIVAALLSMLAPMLPILIVALVGWAIYRASVPRLAS